jgi:DNA-binding MarR family transcriptional regulator
MARDGLIDRRGSSGDRRVIFAALTEAGLDQARQADEAYRAFLRDEVMSVVSSADLATVSTIAARLAQLHGEPDLEPTFRLAPRPSDEPDRRND